MTVTHTYVRTYLSSLFFNYTLIGSGYMYTFIAEVTKTTESMYVFCGVSLMMLCVTRLCLVRYVSALLCVKQHVCSLSVTQSETAGAARRGHCRQ